MTETLPKDQQDAPMEIPMDALILQIEKDRYKISYAVLRWAKEIKRVENLPEPILKLIPRALREILTGKVDLKTVEDLPLAAKISQPQSSAPAVPANPTITINVSEPVEEEPKTEGKEAAPKKEDDAKEEK